MMNQKNQVAWTSKQRNSPLFSKMIENRMTPLSTKEVEIPCYSCKKKNYRDLVFFGVPFCIVKNNLVIKCIHRIFNVQYSLEELALSIIADAFNEAFLLL